MTARRPLMIVATVATLLAMLHFAGPPSAAARTWAPAATASIHPGTQTVTEIGQCTANFVFTDGGGNVYIGQAAHCTGTGASNETNGCDAASLPEGAPVEVDGASRPGIMVYNSWRTMQRVGETDPNACAYNDFALVRIHPDDYANVNPSIPVWGGPNGISGPLRFGDAVYSFGNSSLRQGIEALSPKYGITLGTTGDGWVHPLYTVTPGIPGDSGSAYLGPDGSALGVLSTIALAPLAGSNNIIDIGHAISYANAHTSLNVSLADGTEAFDGDPISGLVGGLLGGL